jgi:RNA polymerase sigma factor (sigma-70 family)
MSPRNLAAEDVHTQPQAAAAQHRNSSAGGLQDYLRLLSRIPLLSPAEELHLGGIVQKWLRHPDPSPGLRRSGARARDRMISANLRLVVAMCRRYRGRIEHQQLEMLDLLQAGNLGLIRAVEKFDPSRGYKFSTYGSWWIRQSVQRHMQGFGSSIKIPSQVQSLAYRASLLQAGSQQVLSSQAMADSLGEPVRQLEMSLQVVSQCRTLSLDQPLASGDGESCLMDVVSDENIFTPEEDYHWLHAHVHTLGAPEQKLLMLRYGSHECRSLSEAARMMGVSKSYVQGLERRTLRKLRHRLTHVLAQPGST